MDFEEVLWTILEKNPILKAKFLIDELGEKTDLARSTIYQRLTSLIMQGKIMREKGYYSLPEKKFKSKHRNTRARRQLSLGFEAILYEDWALWRIEEPSFERAKLEERIEREGQQFKKFAVEHLKTGYRSTFKKMERWCKLKDKIRSALKGDGNSEDMADIALNLKTFLGDEQPRISKRVEQLLEQRERLYQELKSDIREIQFAVEQGRSLKGRCGICS